MAVISVTRLHLRSWRFFPSFLIYSLRSARQAKRSPGFLAGALASDAERGFWTLTVWRDEEGMRSFRGSGAHVKAMPRLLHWCDEASVGNWTDGDAALPDMTTAFERLRDHGRPSKLRYPSERHAGGRTVGEAPPTINQKLST